MSAYYNENDPAMAAWLAELMARGLIAKGHIDTRSITEVQPSDLNGFTQCHFFAGIGGWSAALRLAGWADDRPVWTGSCPCQPFSAAGKGKGTDDERHLWPVFRDLIRECRPDIIFGEQVASAAVVGPSTAKAQRRLGKALFQCWLDGVCADLEAAHYACGAADLPAACVGAPHPRQRLYWVANAIGERHTGQRLLLQQEEGGWDASDFPEIAGRGATDGMGNTTGDNQRGNAMPGIDGQGQPVGGSSGLGAWSDFRIVHCLDGKARRIGTGIQPLAHGISGRVAVVRPAFGSQPASPEEIRWVNRRAALQGAGNAIVPQLAAEFIAAFDDVLAAADADRAPAVAGV